MHMSLFTMIRSMSGIAQGVLILLLLMSIRSLAITIASFLRYRAARNQTQSFVHLVAPVLGEGLLDEALSIAEQNKKSHIAKVVASGLTDFRSASQEVSSAIAIESAKSGLDRAAMVVHSEMKRGLSGLATIGSTAPFVGLFGTVIGIVNAFRSTSLNHSGGLAVVSSGISEALITTALGLLVAVPAVWSYNYLTGKLDAFDIEMKNSSMELVTYLAARQSRRN